MPRRRPPDPPPPTRWQCRYSPSEMLYLEITATGVRQYLDHAPRHADHYTFAEVLAGKIDADIRNLFGQQALDELKTECRDRLGQHGGTAR